MKWNRRLAIGAIVSEKWTALFDNIVIKRARR